MLYLILKVCRSKVVEHISHFASAAVVTNAIINIISVRCDGGRLGRMSAATTNALTFTTAVIKLVM
jgi:hypothetical protein